MQLRAQIDQELLQRLSQTLCLMIADVVGSSAFYQKHGDVQGRLFIQRHHDTITPLIAEHAGKVIKTIGDALMAAFEDAEQALPCAIAIQHKLWDEGAQGPDDTALRTKVSLHYGTALVEANDINGDLVNMSARLNEMAEPDQILISQTVYDRVKAWKEPLILPLSVSGGWKKGERGLPVYEVLWRQQAEAEGRPEVFRTFDGAYRTCFYCGLPEHPVSQCPSKQLTGHTRRLEQLGYLPLSEILRLFQQEDLSASALGQAKAGKLFEAFYELMLPYQLRFLLKVWLATTEDWSSLERQPTPTGHSLAGTRLWMALDCHRVGRYDQAKSFLLSALESNPGDYKPYTVLGFVAMENEEPHTALRHWRKGLSLVKTPLQASYMHLLIHRLYTINGKLQLAQQELQQTLTKDPYLHEAKYRQIALLVQEDRADEALSRLGKLIQDDRSVYVKALLDPELERLRDRIRPLLTTLCQAARTKAMACLRNLTEDINSLREWYGQPEGELVPVEQALQRLRQHIKSDSYFGYSDATQEGDALQAKIHTVLGRRKTLLQREYTTTLAVLEELLRALSRAHNTAPVTERLAKLQRELARLQVLTGFHTPAEFWRAWEKAQRLKAAVHELNPAAPRGNLWAPRPKRLLRSLLPFGIIGSVLVDIPLFAVLGYFTYFSEFRLPPGKLLLLLASGALVGYLCGSAVGLLVQGYRSRR